MSYTITAEQTNIEQRYHQLQLMYEALRSAISHSISDPIRLTEIECEAILVKNDLPADVEHRIKVIEMAAKEVSRCLTILKEFAYIRENHFTSVDMNKVMGEACDRLKTEISATQTKLYCESLPKVYGNQSLLVQLMEHLIRNAIQYCGNKRPEITIRGHKKGNHVEISVQDNGIGINPLFKKLVFSAFQRLNQQQTFSGTGMGLTYSQKIVHEHGGQIWFDSKEGEGTTFRFTLQGR